MGSVLVTSIKQSSDVKGYLRAKSYLYLWNQVVFCGDFVGDDGCDHTEEKPNSVYFLLDLSCLLSVDTICP